MKPQGRVKESDSAPHTAQLNSRTTKMIKANKNTLLITSIVTMLPVLAGVLLWNRLPDMMATHFGADNQADGLSSKAFAVFGIPLIGLVILWVAAFVTAHDPKKQHISPKMFSLVLWIIIFSNYD